MYSLKEESRPYRTTAEVFRDHLSKLLTGDLDADLMANFAPDVAVLSEHGVERGHEAIRKTDARLKLILPGRRTLLIRHAVFGDVAYLHWQAEAGDRSIRDGVDFYQIRDGMIRLKATHYTVTM